MDCIDLRERYGKQFRIAYDEAYDAEHGATARAEDTWLQIIPGRRGHVFPWSQDRLAVATNGRGPTVTRLLAVPGLVVVQDGSDGINATFPPEAFPAVAQIVGLRRRKYLSPEHRAKVVAAGKAALERHRGANSNAPENELERIGTV